jgi:hypothetical protein
MNQIKYVSLYWIINSYMHATEYVTVPNLHLKKYLKGHGQRFRRFFYALFYIYDSLWWYSNEHMKNESHILSYILDTSLTILIDVFTARALYLFK